MEGSRFFEGSHVPSRSWRVYILRHSLTYYGLGPIHCLKVGQYDLEEPLIMFAAPAKRRIMFIQMENVHRRKEPYRICRGLYASDPCPACRAECISRTYMCIFICARSSVNTAGFNQHGTPLFAFLDHYATLLSHRWPVLIHFAYKQGR